jgi:hypothetical protein
MSSLYSVGVTIFVLVTSFKASGAADAPYQPVDATYQQPSGGFPGGYQAPQYQAGNVYGGCVVRDARRSA